MRAKTASPPSTPAECTKPREAAEVSAGAAVDKMTTDPAAAAAAEERAEAASPAVTEN